MTVYLKFKLKFKKKVPVQYKKLLKSYRFIFTFSRPYFSFSKPVHFKHSQEWKKYRIVTIYINILNEVYKLY